MKDDRIEFAGVTYLSSTEAAREMRYTKDYIGQLARAGKIDAKLIGRSWYVSEESIKEHKSSVNYTLTKQKKPRSKIGSRVTEKPNVHIHNSSSQVERSLPATPPVQESVHQDIASPDRENLITSPEPENGYEPVSIPIRTAQKNRTRDVLLDAHFEYEPGQPLNYDDVLPYPKINRVARFERTPIVHQGTRSQISVSQRVPQTITNRPPQHQDRALYVPMDGVVGAGASYNVARASSRRDPLPQKPMRSQSYVTDRTMSTNHVSTYGTPARRRERSWTWLIVLLSFLLVAGLASIVWILFGNVIV